VTFAAPVIGLVGAVVAMAYFYTINTSTTVDTLQSWSCRWQDINMLTRPHFGTLCKQSRAGLYLSIILIPVEAVILGVAGYQVGLERYINTMAQGRKSSSPALSWGGKKGRKNKKDGGDFDVDTKSD
jgi:Na+/H+ antiporter NhaC